MKEDTVWFGFLEAGEKSSPVARDTQLETSKPSTVYLFNLRREAFIEYSLEIVQAKLREFTAEEKSEYHKTLTAAFKKARKTFKGKGIPSLAKSSPAPQPAPKKEVVEETVDAVDDDDDSFVDEDWNDD